MMFDIVIYSCSSSLFLNAIPSSFSFPFFFFCFFICPPHPPYSYMCLDVSSPVLEALLVLQELAETREVLLRPAELDEAKEVLL